MSKVPTQPAEHEKALARLSSDAGSRARFLKMMGGGLGAAGAFSLLVAACGGDDEAATTAAETGAAGTTTGAAMSGEGDLAIVNYALTLEYLEADFYAKVADSGLFKGAQLEVIKTFGDHEQQHVDALMQTAQSLGEPAAKPETQFELESADAVLELAATVENLGAAAYLGQAANIENDEILAAALAIHSVEARHAAALNRLLGKSSTPDGAFGKPASMDEVLEQVQPFIVS